MQTQWDYTLLADAYLKRPDYADAAIDAMLSVASVVENDPICDIGAGVGHLTIKLAARFLDLIAVEPNLKMRENGAKRTGKFHSIKWFDGIAENTGQETDYFKMVTFGSSFNVCDRQAAMRESARILQSGGWFACMWNHRNLDDEIQKNIEEIIRKKLPNYAYGIRREDQTQEIESSRLFSNVVQIESRVIHQQSLEDCKQAWHSHATLQRHAGDNFKSILQSIESYLDSLNTTVISIPYSTRIWMAQRL